MTNPKLDYAATVMLLRDTERGMEVLLLERSGKSESFAGAFVFPGGKVDLHDAHRDYAALYAGHTDVEASNVLGMPRYGLAYWTGAIRECFEEAGILLAYDKSGELVSFRDPAVKQRFVDYRARLNSGSIKLLDICRDEQLTLATERIAYFSHWVTPVVAPRRFDTRFFVCRVPDYQEALIDNREAVSQCWLTPAEALRKADEENFQIFFPTRKHVEALSEFDNTDGLLTATQQKTKIPRILPLRQDTPDGFRILLPGDDGYEYREIAETHY